MSERWRARDREPTDSGGPLPEFTRHWGWETTPAPSRTVDLAPGNVLWFAFRDGAAQRAVVARWEGDLSSRDGLLVVELDSGELLALHPLGSGRWIWDETTTAEVKVPFVVNGYRVSSDGRLGRGDVIGRLWPGDLPRPDAAAEPF